MQHNRTITMRNANVHVHHIYIISMMQNSGVPYRVQPPASTTPPINGNAKGVVSVHIKTVSEDILPDSLPPHFGPIMPTTLGKTTPPGWTSPDQAQAKEQTDATRRRAQKNQSQRRRRAELTPSNKDVAKALGTQSRRRKRAERSPEDMDQANAERRV